MAVWVETPLPVAVIVIVAVPAAAPAPAVSVRTEAVVLGSRLAGANAPVTPAGNPLNNKQKALQEEEQKLKAKMEKYKNFVENAPKIAEQRQREQREELLRRAAMTHKGMGSTALIDRRATLEANVAAPAQQRRMRAERRQGRLMFLILLLTLAGAIFYLYYTVTHG